jgi:Uma2 family endonuclease
VTVVCGPLELDATDKSRQTVLNPSVLIEVQSSSTESDDRGPKLDCYQLIASVQAIVLVAQDRSHVTLHERQADGSFLRSFHESGSVELRAIGYTLPLSEVYEDLPPS